MSDASGSDPFPEHRPNVGIVLFNPAGRVWIGKRYAQGGAYAWQFPQGGIDDGEAPEAAAVRELYEETGVTEDLVEPLGTIGHWLAYDFPPEVLGQRRINRWKGQKQRWFAYRFLGTDTCFDLRTVPPQEFEAFRWEDLSAVPALIIPWKRAVYQEVAAAFAGYSTR
jgi:putative (di)nucleoside polyphosphate hydrolase